MGGIFLSYSRDNADVAQALAADLKDLGHAVWFDDELTGGQTWWDQILARTRSCDVFILALTPQSLGSTACTREYDYAAALGKPILPIVLADGISTNLLPPALAQIQHVDYRSPDRAAGLKLARALRSLPPAGPLPDPLPTPPEVPTSYLGGLAAQASKPSLSYDEQSALLFDLKRGLRETETAADARTLLKQLRKRRDVYAAIAEDIDDSLAAARPLAQRLTPTTAEPPVDLRPIAVATPLAHAFTPERPPAPTVPTPTPPPAPSQAATRLAETEPPPRPLVGQRDMPTANERKVAALVGAVVGSIVGVSGAASDFPDEWFFGLLLGAAGAIAGGVAGARKAVIVGATIGAMVGWVVAAGLWQDPRATTIAGVVFGASPGAILGAIAASLYLKRRRLKAEASPLI
jgi:hypothetical protein